MRRGAVRLGLSGLDRCASRPGAACGFVRLRAGLCATSGDPRGKGRWAGEGEGNAHSGGSSNTRHFPPSGVVRGITQARPGGVVLARAFRVDLWDSRAQPEGGGRREGLRQPRPLTGMASGVPQQSSSD